MEKSSSALSRRIFPLIVCGGAGTRLWPASREMRPKQFIRLIGTRSTFQDTLLRVSDAALFEQAIVITNALYLSIVQEQLAELGIKADIILEPMRRGSGPAIAAGVVFARTHHHDAIVLAINADQAVRDDAAFIAGCREGVVVARSGYMVMFGVKPAWAETEYAYIKAGEVIAGEVCRISKFIEKPDARDAANYLKSGFYWNTGNYMFPAVVLLDHYRKLDPSSFHAIAEAVAKSERDFEVVRLASEEFGLVRSISIDHAVMEKAAHAAVVPVTCGWSDVGSWRAIWELSERDLQGNAARGRAVFQDAQNCNVVTEEALVVVEGVNDLTVVAMPDAILVSNKNGKGLKRLVAKLKRLVPRVTVEHVKVHRPWGSYQSVDSGERHRVRRIIVKPGGRLPLQKHSHWSENLIIVRGTALITVDKTVNVVHENQSISISVGAEHRLENGGKISLELIQVQIGSYVGDDDMIPIQDDSEKS
jgi:mannose-1-phosphate guanylyltransferase/mannose-6-phosphate isomerase